MAGKWRLGYWLLGLSLLLPLAVQAAGASLRLGISDTDTAFPGYVDYTPGEPLTGVLIDFWRCVLKAEALPPVFVRRQLLRLRHELIRGKIDMQLSSFQGPEQVRMVEQNGMGFTDAFYHTHVSLLVRTQDASLLQDGLWQQQAIGVVRQSVFHGDLQRLGGVIGLRANSAALLLKQLMSGRVAVIALPLPWVGEAARPYRGVSLSGRTLLKKSVHSLVSRQSLEADPQLLARINRRIPACQPALRSLQRPLF